MLSLLTTAVLALAAHSSGAAPLRVDGIPVSGQVHAVSVADIRSAIASMESVKPIAVEVIDHDHLRMHLPLQDLGWEPWRRCANDDPKERGGSCWFNDAHAVFDSPTALQVIRTAEQVFVFPVADPRRPHRDPTAMRSLDAPARAAISAFLGDTRHWFHGLDDTIDPGPKKPGVGFLFRKGSSEVVLFFDYQRAKGTSNGETTGGSLEFGEVPFMQAWEQRFARSEMPHAMAP